jgi:hypothetical protein
MTTYKRSKSTQPSKGNSGKAGNDKGATSTSKSKKKC